MRIRLRRNKTLKLKVADKSRVAVIGADKFSCTWKGERASFNYRENGTSGDVVSVEISE